MNVLDLFAFFSYPPMASEFNPFEGPKPIAVLIQTDPWLMVIGSDTPMVALYDNGQIIYLKRGKERPHQLFTHKLDEKGLATVKRELNLIGDFKDIERYYNLAPGVTDLPQSKIYLSFDDTSLVTTAYGLMVSDTKLPALSKHEVDQSPSVLPGVLKKLHLYLTDLDFEDAKPWVPPYVEAMVWGYENAPEESIVWPDKWPGINSEFSIQRGDSYSIFIDGQELQSVKEFLKTRKPKGAVEIDGKKWAVEIRYTFPGEPIWFEAFRNY